MSAIFQPWLGLFETLRVSEGRPLFMDEHHDSLCASSAFFGLPEPPDFREFAPFLPGVNGRWRWVHSPDQSREFFQPEEFNHPATFALAIAPQRVGSENWDARHKTFSYLTHWQAKYAVEADEALLLNEHGHVASGAMSNIFWVTKGQLYTPALEAGCRNGVVRQWIMRHWIEHHHPVLEAHMSLDTMLHAEEIFLSSSGLGVKPVTKLEEQEFAVGPVTRQLLLDYADRTAAPS